MDHHTQLHQKHNIIQFFIMSHWNNFPANSSMTDFEIIVVQNERARLERDKVEEKSNILTHDSREDDEDAMALNILSKARLDSIPIPLTPIHPTPTPPLMESAVQPKNSMEPFGMNSAMCDETIIEEDINLDTIATKINVSTESGSSGSYRSIQSSNTSPKLAIILQELRKIQLSKRKHIPFRENDTSFMDDINNLNVNRNKRTILISSVRPSFQRHPHNEFFVCHVCHKNPIQIKISEELWDFAVEKDNDKLGDELPFVYNLRGIIDHLTKFHCFTHEDKSRDMIVAVANYIDMVNQDIEDATSTMFTSTMFTTRSIPKSSSTSCLNVSWKSNQTHLTKELAHTYNFKNYTSVCNGHPKLKATQGLAYEFDLAENVYCSCSATSIMYGTMDLQERQAVEEILDPTLNVSQDKTFFNQEKKSIYQSHRTLLCNYKIFQSLPNFSKRTYVPTKPITRKDKEDGLEEKSHQKESSQDTTPKRFYSGQDQQHSFDRKLTCCQIIPPGEVRLRPEGKSPPVHSYTGSEGCPQPVPPVDLKGRPAGDRQGSGSVKAVVEHAMATAASLLKPARPQKQSTWL